MIKYYVVLALLGLWWFMVQDRKLKKCMSTDEKGNITIDYSKLDEN